MSASWLTIGSDDTEPSTARKPTMAPGCGGVEPCDGEH